MTQYTCISIGINSYYNFQPLNYGIGDGEGLVQCLKDHGNLPDDQSLLMTDLSPRVGNYPTYPNRENILNWLSNGYQTNGLNSSSILWFFFSGYGLHYQGQDYLIPIDGDPQDLINTAIPIEKVFTLLQQQGAGKIVVMLDINRSPGMLGEKGVGEQIIHLAGKMGIACVLGSHPHQYSHEAASLGHGMFTCALLEGIKYYRRDLTLGNLDRYLNERLPELSEHHWRPIQNPLVVSPMADPSQTPILPTLVSSDIVWSNLAPFTEESVINGYLNGASFEEVSSVAVGLNGTNGTGKGVYQESNVITLSPPRGNNGSSNGNSGNGIGELNGNGKINLPIPEFHNEENLPDIPRATRKKSKGKSGFSGVNLPQYPWQKLLIKGISAVFIVTLLILGIYQVVSRLNSSNSSVSESNPDSNNTVITEIPEGQPPVNPEVDSIGKEYLKEANLSFQNAQASDFNNAINLAKKVPENDPYYSQAQASIHRWSQIIWDIAQSRADQGNFSGAIASAKLITEDQNAIYAEAQNAIQEWETKDIQQTENNEIFQKAKSLINPRQASSYVKAMQLIENIAPGETGYEEARELRNQWSRQVYLIANSRASRGKYQLAIQTALLVPQDSPSYEDTQNAIARWQQGKP
jgi:hypothetical protein